MLMLKNLFQDFYNLLIFVKLIDWTV